MKETFIYNGKIFNSYEELESNLKALGLTIEGIQIVNKQEHIFLIHTK